MTGRIGPAAAFFFLDPDLFPFPSNKKNKYSPGGRPARPQAAQRHGSQGLDHDEVSIFVTEEEEEREVSSAARADVCFSLLLLGPQVLFT